MSILLFLTLFACSEKDTNETSNVLVDTDGDGLSDEEEAALGTNPANADSDGDGLDDWFEGNSS